MSNGGLGKILTCLRGSRNKSVKKSRDFFLYFFLLHHLHTRPFSVIVSAIEPHDYKLFVFYFQQKKMKMLLEAIEISGEKEPNLIK